MARQNYNFIDEIGNQYTYLTVLERGTNTKYGGVQWRCRCTCGTIKLVRGQHLRGGKITSCGCRSREIRTHWARDRVTNGNINWRPRPDGYVRGTAKYHPLGNGAMVYQHWHNFWLYHNRADWVVEVRKSGATLHHKNGIRDDNRPENLELRMPGQHPQGWSVEAMIEVLEGMGNRIEAP